MKNILNILLFFFAATQLATTAFANSAVTASSTNRSFTNSVEVSKYDGSTRYNSLQQSTKETMEEFLSASKQAKRRGLKSFHEFALDIAVIYLHKFGPQYMLESEIDVLSIERPDELSVSEVEHVTRFEYQDALHECHDLWIRSDKYKRSYIQYIESM